MMMALWRLLYSTMMVVTSIIMDVDNWWWFDDNHHEGMMTSLLHDSFIEICQQGGLQKHLHLRHVAADIVDTRPGTLAPTFSRLPTSNLIGFIHLLGFLKWVSKDDRSFEGQQKALPAENEINKTDIKDVKQQHVIFQHSFRRCGALGRRRRLPLTTITADCCSTPAHHLQSVQQILNVEGSAQTKNIYQQKKRWHQTSSTTVLVLLKSQTFWTFWRLDQ